MEQFLGEIRIFCGNFPPRGWAFCDGSLMPLSQNTALFSILGTRYGGDGKTTFALPNMGGRTPIHQGAGPGLSDRTVGEAVGSETVTLLETEMPAHNHVPQSQTTADSIDPTGNIWADVASGKGAVRLYSSAANVSMNIQAVQYAGNNQPHNNMQPYLGLNFIIALEGVFPARP